MRPVESQGRGRSAEWRRDLSWCLTEDGKGVGYLKKVDG